MSIFTKQRDSSPQLLLRKYPKNGTVRKNPGRTDDCKENPLWNRADLEDPSEDLVNGIEKAMDGHKVE